MLSLLKRWLTPMPQLLFIRAQQQNAIPDYADEFLQLIDERQQQRLEEDLELQLLLTPGMNAPDAPVPFTQRQRTAMQIGVSMCFGVPAAWAYCNYAMGMLRGS